MSLRPDHLKRLARLGLSAEAYQEVLSIIADTHERSKGAERVAKWRASKANGVTSNVTNAPGFRASRARS